MQIGSVGTEQQIEVTDEYDFVEKQDVPAGESAAKDNWAYRFEGPEGYVIFVQGGTEFAPEFRASNGDKLDPSTRVIWQKCDKQGNPLSEFIINGQLGRWNYEKMRRDPDFRRYTQQDLMLDEREIAKIFVEIPSSGSAMSASDSRLTVGDVTSDYGTPVEIVDHDGLSGTESQAVKAASQRGN
jgi:YD repeat-containing protein